MKINNMDGMTKLLNFLCRLEEYNIHCRLGHSTLVKLGIVTELESGFDKTKKRSLTFWHNLVFCPFLLIFFIVAGS